MTLKDKKKEIAFCRYISTLYSDDSRKIDYLIGYTYIKLFFILIAKFHSIRHTFLMN